MHAKILKFYIWIPHEKIAGQYLFFLSELCHILELCPFKEIELNLVSKISRSPFDLGA